MIILDILIGSVVIACTTYAALLVWFQGSIFARVRSWLEARQHDYWWAKLPTCSLCLSVWATAFMTLAYFWSFPLDSWVALPWLFGMSLFTVRFINSEWTVNPAEE